MEWLWSITKTIKINFEILFVDIIVNSFNWKKLIPQCFSIVWWGKYGNKENKFCYIKWFIQHQRHTILLRIFRSILMRCVNNISLHTSTLWNEIKCGETKYSQQYYFLTIYTLFTWFKNVCIIKCISNFYFSIILRNSIFFTSKFPCCKCNLFSLSHFH